MMPSSDVLRFLSSLFHQPLTGQNLTAACGGCINQTFILNLAEGKKVFCKLNSATRFPLLFEKEKAGLLLLGRQNTIRVPEVIDCATVNDRQILLLEWILEGPRTDAFWQRFGEALARLHAVSADAFGGPEDNFMGSVPQRNSREKDWVTFFTEHRLRPLAASCAQSGLLSTGHLKKLDSLCLRLDTYFEPEKPALVHGDLWSGNFICSHRSEPVLIDPAVYFGHRSADLGMTTLFGGFASRFYEAYHYHYALPSNFREQWELCNLYPLLIHLLLFGSSYRSQIEQTLNAYV